MAILSMTSKTKKKKKTKGMAMVGLRDKMLLEKKPNFKGMAMEAVLCDNRLLLLLLMLAPLTAILGEEMATGPANYSSSSSSLPSTIFSSFSSFSSSPSLSPNSPVPSSESSAGALPPATGSLLLSSSSDSQLNVNVSTSGAKDSQPSLPSTAPASSPSLSPSAPLSSSDSDADLQQSASSGRPLTPLPDPSKPGNKEVYKKALTERVLRVASMAHTLYKSPCDLLRFCQMGAAECTRLACGYAGRDDVNFRDYNCVKLGFKVNSSGCYNDSDWRLTDVPSTCGSILLSFERPFARFPELAKLKSMVAPKPEIPSYRHTCVQRGLTESFREAIASEDDFRVAGWVYFASVAGTLLAFPGQNVFDGFGGEGFPLDCEPYDPRHRPWYTQGSSPPKKIAIVADLGYGMGTPLRGNSVDPMLRIDILKRALIAFNKTLQDRDIVSFTVVPQGSNANQPAQHENRGGFLQEAVENMQAPKENGPGDLGEYIQTALRKLGEPSKSHINLLLVFTRSPVNAEAAASAIQEYSNRSLLATGNPLATFLYGVDIVDSAVFSNLTSLADRTGGIARNIGLGDPLLGVYSLLNFLAQSFRGTAPTWARLYPDAFSLGLVTTLTKPVYDSEGKFVGIAGLDVKRPILAEEIAGSFEMLDVPVATSTPKETLKLPPCTLPCEDGYTGLDCTSGDMMQDLQRDDVLCPKADKSPEKRKCCQECSGTRLTFHWQAEAMAALVIAALLGPSGPWRLL